MVELVAVCPIKGAVAELDCVVFSPKENPAGFTSEMYNIKDINLPYEPRHVRTCLWGFRPGPTQTGLYSH